MQLNTSILCVASDYHKECESTSKWQPETVAESAIQRSLDMKWAITYPRIDLAIYCLTSKIDNSATNSSNSSNILKVRIRSEYKILFYWLGSHRLYRASRSIKAKLGLTWNRSEDAWPSILNHDPVMLRKTR